MQLPPIPQPNVTFRINDSTKGFPERAVEADATQDELRRLVDEGFLLKRGLFSEADLEALGEAIDRLEAEEREHPDGEHLSNNGFYLRSLMDKDKVFRDLLHFKPTLSIARAVLGPQVWFGVEARIAPADEPGRRVPWHIHTRVIPDPIPPFFSYPHQIHCLLYLDDVGEREGPLVILPGSHRQHALGFAADDTSDYEGQVELQPRRGDVMMIHCNLWHRTQPTQAGCTRRRVVLFGYQPAWMKSEVERGVRPKQRLTEPLLESGDPEMVELLDGFHW